MWLLGGSSLRRLFGRSQGCDAASEPFVSTGCSEGQGDSKLGVANCRAPDAAACVLAGVASPQHGPEWVSRKRHRTWRTLSPRSSNLDPDQSSAAAAKHADTKPAEVASTVAPRSGAAASSSGNGSSSSSCGADGSTAAQTAASSVSAVSTRRERLQRVGSDTSGPSSEMLSPAIAQWQQQQQQQLPASPSGSIEAAPGAAEGGGCADWVALLGTPPQLGRQQALQDDHLGYVIRAWLRPPPHVWVATPAEALLLQSGQEAKDLHAKRDGSLRQQWDRAELQMLLLPLTCDAEAGRSVDAGEHWSVLLVRRHRDSRSGWGAVTAELHDSLSSTAPGAVRNAQQALAQLSQSDHWQSSPRRPRVVHHGVQKDNYQCGIYCLLIMHQLLQAERGPHEFKLTAARAKRLRDQLCDLASCGG